MEGLFKMTKKNLSAYNLILKVKERELKQVRAAQILGVSERHFRRLLKAYKEEGVGALVSKKLGMKNRGLKPEVRQQIIDKLKTDYEGFGPTFAWEKLVKRGKINVCVETIRKIMIEEGLWEVKKRRRLKVHQQRNRRSCEGELIQMDGSPEAWFEERAPKCCLLGFIDDATSKIEHLQFVPSESSASYLKALKQYMQKHGKPLAFYTDRLNVFRINNDKEGYRKQGLTQVGRALKELEIELICANSPQAKGRVERLFNTLQDRLIKELRLRQISSMKEGNIYLEEYIKEHNDFFAVPAAKPENMHRCITEEEIKKPFATKKKERFRKT